MKTRRIPGSWWTRFASDKRLPGTLTIAASGNIRLHLYGSFGNADRLRDSVPTILGTSVKGRPITIQRCERIRAFGGPHGETTDYAADEVYIGAHFDVTDELPRFRHVRAEYSHLLAWARFSAWLREHRLDVAFTSSPRSITWQPERLLSATYKESRLNLKSWMEPEGAFNHDVRVRRRLWLEIEASTPLSTEEWHQRFLYPFRHLLTLGTTRANALVAFAVIPEDPTKDRQLPVSVFNYWVGIERNKNKWLTPSDMLMHLGDIETDFPRVLDRWFATYEKFRPICDNFFGLAYNPPVYVDQKFLTVVQAAEAYHREAVRRYKIDPETHESRVKAVLASTPEAHRDWLRDVLAAAVEPSLNERLQSLLERMDDVIAPLTVDRSAFLRKAVRTRHLLTHPATRDSESVPNPNAIFRLFRTFSFLMQRCFLHELGLMPEHCQKLFARNRDYVWAKSDLGDA